MCLNKYVSHSIINPTMFASKFFKLFPSPDFLTMPRVGIDISDEAVRFVEFIHTKQGLKLGRFGERLLPKGTVDSGYIQDSQILIEHIKDLKREFKFNFVRAAMPEEKAYLFKIEIPRVDESQIRSAIELRLEENVPLNLSQAIFDYEIIRKDLVQGDTMEVSVSVLPEKVVSTYLDVFLKAGLTPLDFEIEGRAISRAFVKETDTGTYMIINFAERRTGIFIVSEGVVCFSSSLSIGGEALTSTLAKSLSISFEEADKIKHSRDKSTKNSINVFEYSINTLAALKDEVSKVYTYWHDHGEKDKKIGAIILSGENSSLVGLDEYLTISLKAPVVQGNPWVNAFSFSTYIPPMDYSKALSYAVSIGLALAHNHHV
ncbi:MAG: hypothetical protein EXS47_02425 [Candidatus Zambryskibacteria bacterium]|nr:hypothetical protein [Candidatus Zambryskibacteria bacterium]